MTPRIKLSVVFSSLLFTLLLVVGAVLGRGEEKEGAYQPLSVYTQVLSRIKSDYVEDPDIAVVTRGAMQGLVEYLDPQSSYLTAEQYEELKKSVLNPDGGSGLSSGMIVQKRGNYATVLSVLPGSPADGAGIRSGDLVEAVDGLSSRMMPPAYLQAVLSGKPGEPVELLVRSARQYDEPQEHVLRRSKVELPDVSFRMLADKVGYVDLDVVDEERIKQTAKALRQLEKQGAEKLILDLRGNSVGKPEVGAALADLFVSEGRLASLKGQRYPEKVFQATPAVVSELPLVVLTDRPTSGAAEVAAAALLDLDRAQIAGERTYGLAAAQETIELEGGAALILSVAKYYRADGEALHDSGVAPSLPIDPAELRRFRRLDGSDEEPPAEGSDEDPFLKKALDFFAGEAQPEAAEAKAA